MPNKLTTPIEHLTFSQRYGYEALPEPMQLEKLSDTLRREVWGATREFLIVFRVSSNWEGFYFKDEEICRFIENILGKHLELAHDEIQLGYSDVEKQIKKVILKAQFNKVLDLIEDIANEPYERIVNSRNNVISTLLREKFQGSRENLINTYKRQFEKQAAEGIRHARLNRDSSGVGLDEAVFMFGACAFFAAYLVSKNRQMEQQESK